ncbi:hypothetical protein [Flagellimonas flava]|uniref:hypothetical protein n=1 Tax=Flagellimonas flava TaxID=570519 RepID=UPI003D656871
MHNLTILWALFCASVIVGYPIYLYHRSMVLLQKSKKSSVVKANNMVELLSFDLRGQLPSWSISLDVPQITEEVLCNNPILFYLETEESHLKMPLNNEALGYTANVYKNTGKVYLTFKCLKDSVSNFHVPAWHANQLKILIIKPRHVGALDHDQDSYKVQVYKELKKAKINLSQFEEVLAHFNPMTNIDQPLRTTKGLVAAPKTQLSSAAS